MPIRYSEQQIRELLKKYQEEKESPPSGTTLPDDPVLECDVFIAGSGPIG